MNTHYTDWPPKKSAIVEATISTIAKEGSDHTTTAKIARNANVGEGTIYRYFKNKDDLISAAAFYTASMIFGPAREHFNPEASVHAQFIQFVTDVLTTGKQFQQHHQFLEQFLNSPAGIAYRKKTLAEVIKNPDLKPILYPLNRILIKAQEQEIVKDFPLQLLVALSMGPIMFILKHSAQGFMDLNKEMIADIAKSCWDAIRR